MKSCFFIGHREASDEIFHTLEKTVERHIVEYGVTEFIVGNYGGFDRLAAKAVIAAKERHPDSTLAMLIPYHPAERPITHRLGVTTLFILRVWEKFPGGWRLFEPIGIWWITRII